jgi:hypothetical protein
MGGEDNVIGEQIEQPIVKVNNLNRLDNNSTEPRNHQM